MTKDLAGFDYSDFYRWEWTGFQRMPAEMIARGFWIARPHDQYTDVLPNLHVNEELTESELREADLTLIGTINDNYGAPARYRYKSWVCLELMMSFSIMTMKRCKTKGWPVSQWNQLFHEQGLIELYDGEIEKIQQLEQHFNKLSRAIALEGEQSV